jgi:hypothetical protein
MAVEAVCCELVSEFPRIREKYRVILPILEFFPESSGDSVGQSAG